MEFSRQEYLSGLPFPSPGDLPDPGFEPRSPVLGADALPSGPPGNLYWEVHTYITYICIYIYIYTYTHNNMNDSVSKYVICTYASYKVHKDSNINLTNV